MCARKAHLREPSLDALVEHHHHALAVGDDLRLAHRLVGHGERGRAHLHDARARGDAVGNVGGWRSSGGRENGRRAPAARTEPRSHHNTNTTYCWKASGCAECQLAGRALRDDEDPLEMAICNLALAPAVSWKRRSNSPLASDARWCPVNAGGEASAWRAIRRGLVLFLTPQQANPEDKAGSSGAPVFGGLQDGFA